MNDHIDISRKSPAAVLAALYNAAPCGPGLSAFQYQRGDVTEADAAALIERHGTNFDYVQGRVLKVDLAEHPMRIDLYDRDNGSGAGARAIEALPDAVAAP